MKKLYKTIEGTLHYWETWEANNTTGIFHWGIVGEKGEYNEVKSGLLVGFRTKMKREIEEKMEEGFAEIDEDQISYLEIEFKINGFGTEEDLDKRHKLEERMDQTLGWTGLGHSNGGSIGSGTMEVGCAVVDFDIAKRVIEEDLKGTEFEDYTRIFEMK